MKAPISWLKDYVDIDLPIVDLAHRLTLAGLEVDEIRYVGLPLPDNRLEEQADTHQRPETKISGLAWDPEKIVVGAILEVMPHPNADRLILCRLDDGQEVHTVLTGAPNLFPFTGKGALEKPLKVAYAREGARIYDGHRPGRQIMTLKRANIRGVESYSMACSEKELGISDDHEGVIILDDDAPVGAPLQDYMGDAVLDIEITPNMARATSIYALAREVAALTGAELRPPDLELIAEGPPIEGKVSIEIEEPELNPRFVLGLIENIQIKPSPYWVQRRLRLAGMRPINNMVDATNYAMLELGEPLHAFDYDILVERAGEQAPTIITRTAVQGEKLTTLDDVQRQLDDFTVLVCDTAGPLSIAGVMGGEESEVSEHTRNVLLEGAAWNFINIRRTAGSQRMSSEAAYRFERGVHPSLASQGVRRGLELMRQWSGGVVYQGLVDNYPLPPDDPIVEVSPQEVRRWLGIELSAQEIAEILISLEFKCELVSENGSVTTVRATTPPHRLDIGKGITGMADLMEEIARIYGYDRIPETRMADELPPQRSNRDLVIEERVRDLLAGLGLQEVITHRMTTPAREALRLPPGSSHSDSDYFWLVNPISSDRTVMRRSLIASVLETIERNARLRERIAIFEIGPVYLPSEQELPAEPQRVVIAITGPRSLPSWQEGDTTPMDFYDLKGILAALFEGLHIEKVRYEPGKHPSFHPGKSARVFAGEDTLGMIGELHPLVGENYDLPETPLIAADLSLDVLLSAVPVLYDLDPIPSQPPVLEDIAFVVDDDLPAQRVAEVIQEAGGETLVRIQLFDVYRGEQVAAGKKSLAYNLTYQNPERTLTDQEVAKTRNRIVRRLEKELSAKLRSW